MRLSRSSIQRGDFATVRRGYDPAAVDAHLREIADAAEDAAPRPQPVAAAASAQVGRILEAAESTAQQLREEASREAREHVARVSGAAGDLLTRLSAMQDELAGLVDQLRALERGVAELGSGAVEPPEAREPEPMLPPEPKPEPVAAAPLAPEPEPEPEPVRPVLPEDEDAARLVALDMALGGTPREDTERYLAEHYSIPDPGRLLDDVYALAGS